MRAYKGDGVSPKVTGFSTSGITEPLLMTETSVGLPRPASSRVSLPWSTMACGKPSSFKASAIGSMTEG